jgi:CRP/FNR family cyclic AMP-dependent transcriptional regulator
VLSAQKQSIASSLVSEKAADSGLLLPRPRRCRPTSDHFGHVIQEHPSTISDPPPLEEVLPLREYVPPLYSPAPQHIDPLYLFGCHVDWEKNDEPSSAWELISAMQNGDAETRVQARAFLAKSRHLTGMGSGNGADSPISRRRHSTSEEDMKTPYDLEIIENCTECTCTNESYFCGFTRSVLESLDYVSHKSTLPAGAILFVEGQAPRGIFVICSGKVNLSTTSREGKILILKTAFPGQALGMSAVISGMGYETTAETATPCQLNFVDRNKFLELMQSHSEFGMHAAQCLSRDFRSAHRDIHDLVLTRSSAGKLARLLLSQSPMEIEEAQTRIHSSMTHEEMAQRIGASRETVTRLLSNLRRKHLIRLDGPTLIIRDRAGLEALSR